MVLHTLFAHVEAGAFILMEREEFSAAKEEQEEKVSQVLSPSSGRSNRLECHRKDPCKLIQLTFTS